MEGLQLLSSIEEENEGLIVLTIYIRFFQKMEYYLSFSDQSVPNQTRKEFSAILDTLPFTYCTCTA
jgi:hypothetical protein